MHAEVSLDWPSRYPNVLFGHSAQLDCDVCGLYVPARHRVHAEVRSAPVGAENLPAGHSLQPLDPGFAEKLPPPHGRQFASDGFISIVE